MDDDDEPGEWVEPDYDPGSEAEFLATLTTLDLGEADLIITPSSRAAEWARANGYQIEVDFWEHGTIYKIMPGGSGIEP